MTALQTRICEQLYGHDIWADFEPSRPCSSVQGWNGDHPSLTAAIARYSAPLVLDVGAWKGQATVMMATEMKRYDMDGCVVAIDSFLGSPEHWKDALFGRRTGFPDLYETFLNNVVHAEVADFVVPLPQPATGAAEILRSLDVRADVVHLDASHSYAQVLQDAEDYWTLLVSGGTLIGDDFDATWPGVTRAATDFAADHRLQLTIDYPKWILVKP